MSNAYPYRAALGAQPPEQADDDVHTLPFQRSLLGRPGFLHGGAIAGFLAIVCDAKADAEGASHAPATTTMNFLRGGRERATYASASVRARTSRLLVVEASAWQDSPNQPIAMMGRTYMRS